MTEHSSKCTLHTGHKYLFTNIFYSIFTIRIYKEKIFIYIPIFGMYILVYFRLTKYITPAIIKMTIIIINQIQLVFADVCCN